MLELTQKSERTISSLENKIANLEREVATHNVGAEEVNREHSQLMEVIKNDKAMVEVSDFLFSIVGQWEEGSVVLLHVRTV